MTAQHDMFGAPPITPPGERNPRDAYYTPSWATRALIDYMGDRLHGSMWEPCAGNGAIQDLLLVETKASFVLGTDIYSDKATVFPLDFLSVSRPLFATPHQRRADWIVTNPPYRTDHATATDFVRQALKLAHRGVAMLLRVAWLEPCDERVDVLQQTPPTDYIVLPRVNYIGAPGSNNQTSIWFVWEFGKETTDVKHYSAAECRRWGRK